MTTLQEIQAEDNIHKRKVLIIRYLSEKTKYYEKQIAKSSDITQCDDVDYIILASDMFDALQMIEQNFLVLCMTQKEKDDILKKIDSMHDKVVRGGWDYIEGRDDALSELRVFINNMNITK